MISLTQRPPNVILSKSPAWFSVNVSGDNKLVKAKIKSGATDLGTLYSFASYNDVARFELSEFFDTFTSTSFVLPFIESGVRNLVNNTIKTFTVTFSDVEENEITETITVIKGLVSDDLICNANYGSQYSTIESYLDANPLLSLKPKTLFTNHPQQPERLFFFSLTSGSVSLELSIYFSNGDEMHLNPASFSPAALSIWEINCSFAQLVAPHITGNQVQASVYTVQLFSGLAPASPKYTYHVNFNNQSSGSFIFQNALGGFDTFTPTGDLAIKSSRSSSFITTISTPGNIRPNKHETNIDSKTIFSQSSGYFSKDLFNWIPQMLASPKAYWLPHGGSLMPISFVNSNIDIVKSKGDLITTDISYFINPLMAAESQ